MSTIQARPRSRSPIEYGTLTWRVIRDRPQTGERNMALDHSLAVCSEADEAVLRLYSWARPTVSFGRNEPAREAYAAAAADATEVAFVRRPTGGRAVLHDGELTYSVIVPVRLLGGPRAAYEAVNEALASALFSLGAEVSVQAGGPTLHLDAGPCFQSPGPGEVAAMGRKLVGSAQARIGGALLQHGSIILSGDQSLLDELAATARPPGTSGAPGEPGTEAAPLRRHAAPASLHDLIGPIGLEPVADAVIGAMQSRMGGTWSDSVYRAQELAEADRLVSERYGCSEWTWRR